MGKFMFGLAVGIGTTYVLQRMAEKNHEQLLELLQNIPRPIKISPEGSIKSFFGNGKPTNTKLEDADLN